MLTTAEIAAMRTTAQRALPQTATVQRYTRVSDGGGGFTETWADVETTACRLAPVGGGETGTRGGRVADETTHIATLSALVDITEADRLTIDGQVYEVTLVKRRGVWEITRRVEVRQAP